MARSQIGTVESPPRSNRQKYGAWYGMNGAAWCAMFVSWVFWHAGHPLPAIRTKKGFAYCPDIVDYAKRHRIWLDKNAQPKPGDIVLFSFGGKRPDHVGIVEAVLSDGRIQSIDGNTSAGDPRNGGSVARVIRNRSRIVGFVSVAPVEAAPKSAPAPSKPAPAPAAPAPPEDESVRSKVVDHHNGECWLHYGTGYRARLNQGPTHAANVERINAALWQTEGRRWDLRKNPSLSQQMLNTTVDINAINGLTLLGIWTKKALEKLLAHFKLKI